jgi:hypothetical protein
METTIRAVSTKAGHSFTAGVFDLSIGTSLALEGLMGNHPENPVKPPPIDSMNQLWVNVRTIIRNAYSAMGDNKTYVSATELAFMVLGEMTIITAQVKEKRPQASVIYFYNDPVSIKSKFGNINLKIAAQPKQIALDGLLNRALMELSKVVDVTLFDINKAPLQVTKDVILLSHYVTDLLVVSKFPNARLLESMTGKVKGAGLWSTKLGGTGTETLPFCLFTVKLFGDKSGVVNPAPLKLRRAIMEIAQKDRWSVITSEIKLRTSLSLIKDSDLKKEITALL